MPLSTSQRITPTHIAVRYSPPTLHVQYKDDKHNVIRHKTIFIKPNTTVVNAKAAVADLQQRYPHHLTVISDEQLLRMLTTAINGYPPELNSASDGAVAAAKAAMSVQFEARRVGPNDVGYEYDKPIKFDPTEPSEWD